MSRFPQPSKSALPLPPGSFDHGEGECGVGGERGGGEAHCPCILHGDAPPEGSTMLAGEASEKDDGRSLWVTLGTLWPLRVLFVCWSKSVNPHQLYLPVATRALMGGPESCLHSNYDLPARSYFLSHRLEAEKDCRTF